MQDILRDLKSFTSRKLCEEIKEHPGESRQEWLLLMFERAGKQNVNNADWQFWQQHNQPIELSNSSMMTQRLDYLHMNPVKAGFIPEPERWKDRSSRCYAGENGLIAINYY